MVWMVWVRMLLLGRECAVAGWGRRCWGCWAAVCRLLEAKGGGPVGVGAVVGYLTTHGHGAAAVGGGTAMMVTHWWWAAGAGTTLGVGLVAGTGADGTGGEAGAWDHALAGAVETDAESLCGCLLVKNSQLNQGAINVPSHRHIRERDGRVVQL